MRTREPIRWTWVCARVCAWGSGLAFGAVGGAILGVAPHHMEGSQLGALVGGLTGLYCGAFWLQAMMRIAAVAVGLWLGAVLGFACALVSYLAVLVQAVVMGYPLMGAVPIAFFLLASPLLGAVAGFFNAIIVGNAIRTGTRG